MPASIVFNQTGKPAGVAGNARKDLDTGVAVICTNATAAVSYIWTLVDVPIRSALIRGTTGVLNSFTFTPDVKGTYLVTLQIDGSVLPINFASSFCAVVTTGTDTLGWRYLAAGETDEDNIVRTGLGFPSNINTRGWATERDTQEEETENAVALVQNAADTFDSIGDDSLVKLDATTGKIGLTLLPTSNGITALTGDVTATGPGSVAATIANNAVTTVKILDSNVTTTKIADANVTLAKLADLAQDTLIGRQTASTGVPETVVCTGAGRSMIAAADAAAQTALLSVMVGDSGSGGTKGLVPVPAAGDAAASKFLKADGTWATAGGGGGGGNVVARRTVTGPTSVSIATTDHIIYVNTTGGAVTLTLPAHGTTDRMFEIKDIAGTFGTNACTLARDGGTGNIEGLAASYLLEANYQSVTIASDSVSAWWFH